MAGTNRSADTASPTASQPRASHLRLRSPDFSVIGLCVPIAALLSLAHCSNPDADRRLRADPALAQAKSATGQLRQHRLPVGIRVVAVQPVLTVEPDLNRGQFLC